MKTKTKIIRVIENIHMPTVIKSLPNWINNSNSKVENCRASTSSSSSSPSMSDSSHKQEKKLKAKFGINKNKSKSNKITTIENINTPSNYNTYSDISSKYSKDYISKAFIDTFSNKLSTEKRTIVLDEILHKCSPEELHLLRVLIDKNLSEITSSININDNDYNDCYILKNNKVNVSNNMNSTTNVYNIQRNQNHNQNKLSINNSVSGTSITQIPFSSQNSNETLINDSIWSSSSQLSNLQPISSSSLYRSIQNNNNNNLYNYKNIKSFDCINLTNNVLKKSNKKVGSLFDKLADELLIIIFSYLDTQSLAYVSQVNCRWYSLLRDNILWKNLCYTNKYSPFSSSNPLNDSISNVSNHHNTNTTNNENDNHPSQNPQNDSFPFTKTISIQQSMVPVVWKNCNYKNEGFSSSKIPSVNLWNIPWKKTFIQNWRIKCNWKTGRCKVIKKESVPNTLHMAFNNNLVFSVQHGKIGILWDIFSGETIIRITNEDSMISAACFNENYLVIGCINFTLKVYDLKTMELIRELNGHRGEIVSIQNDDEKIISGDENSEIKIWDIATGQCNTTLTGHDGAICTLVFKNNTLISGSVDTTIKIWNIKSKKCLMTLNGHTSYVYCLNFNDQYICSGSGDNTIKVWSLKTGKCLKTLIGHEKGVVCLQFDNQKIISGSIDETIKVWNIKTGKCLYTLLHHSGSIWNIYYSNTHMISSSFDHSLCIWDFASDIY